jgi:hypothetical protein
MSYATFLVELYDVNLNLLQESASHRRLDDATGAVRVRPIGGPESGWLGEMDLRVIYNIHSTVAQDGMNVSQFSRAERYGLDLGFLEWDSFTGGTGGGTLVEWDLMYALVGGIEYGTPVLPPLAVEDDPRAPGVAARVLGPNPTSGVVVLDVAVAAPYAYHLEVIDMLGRTISSEQLPSGVGSVRQAVDLASTAPGHYLIRLRAERGLSTSVIVTRR